MGWWKVGRVGWGLVYGLLTDRSPGAADGGYDITRGYRKSKWWAQWRNSRKDNLSSGDWKGRLWRGDKGGYGGEGSRWEGIEGTDKEVGGSTEVFLKMCGKSGGESWEAEGDECVCVCGGGIVINLRLVKQIEAVKTVPGWIAVKCKLRPCQLLCSTDVRVSQ